MKRSFSQPVTLSCPRCQRPAAIKVWLIVDASERPDLVDRIRDGSLRLLRCDHCGHEKKLDAPLLLHDPDRRRVFFIPPAADSEKKARKMGTVMLRQLAEAFDTPPDYFNDVRVVLFEDLPALMENSDTRKPDDTREGLGEVLAGTFSSTVDLSSVVAELERAGRASDMPRRILLCRQALTQVKESKDPELWAYFKTTLAKNLLQETFESPGEKTGQVLGSSRQAVDFTTHKAMLEEWIYEYAGGSDSPDPYSTMAKNIEIGEPAGAGAGPDDASASTDEGLEPAAERHISVWVDEEAGQPAERLRVNKTYLLNFKVGQAVRGSLLDGPDTLVSAADIPAGGLDTKWVVTSSTVEVAAKTPDTVVSETLIDGARVWTAAFALHIPETGDSAVPQLAVTPRAADGRLQVLVYAGSELYRQFEVQLAAAEKMLPGDRRSTPTGPAVVRYDLVHTPAAQANLAAPHEWTTPPGQTTIAILGQFAIVSGGDGPRNLSPQTIPWTAVQAQVAGPIKNVRNSAESFRARWEAYLDGIDPGDLSQRIMNWTPEYDWTALQDLADQPHRDAWDNANVSSELREFAYDGHALYQSFFPETSPLHAWITSLTPGHRLDISWTPTGNPGWLPHVPWGLMYLFDLPPVGEPLDPMGFLGLRFRLGYTAHEVQAGSKALGRLADAHVGHFLYWGDQPQDVTAVESRWQRQQWAGLQNQFFIPSLAADSNYKTELVRCLDNPAPLPMAVLYFFCQCAVGAGNDPVLRFGNSTQISEVLGRTELGTRKLADQPFVFANACTTSTSDPYIANMLEMGFFSRGSRAYLGTEAKVPIRFASRFAHIFFHFFWRKFPYFANENPPKPMAAGEAVTQTRLFLWTRYRNIGGLFYTYVNQYELFMASAADLEHLRN
ncbi:MAG: CpXC domain-containing protein [Desulfobacterales bacterium]